MKKTEIIEFSESQAIALEKIQQWLKKPAKDLSSKCFVLKGKAGTGKTTIIKYALQDLIEDDLSFTKFSRGSFMSFGASNVAGVTMSHKAKQVLYSSIPICHTFASFFSLDISYNDDGTKDFVPSKKLKDNAPCKNKYKIVVHDECSMYDQKMLDMVLALSNPHTKIVFMGDPGQLPPINADGTDIDSPIFRINIDESSKHELIERVRQTEGNPIIDLSDIIYQEIFGGQDIYKVIETIKTPLINNDIGYNFVKYSEYVEANKCLDKNYLEIKTIAYKNVAVDAINHLIRNNIYQTNERFVNNEIIVMNETFYGENKFALTAFNSEEFIIREVGNVTIDGINCHLVYVQKDNDKDLPPDIFLNIVKWENEQKFNLKKNELMQAAIRERDFKQRKLKWKFYYDFVEQFANVSYGYAFTGYKAQGSTYRQVFVDINDILMTKPISDKRKLQAVYTAVTRASHKVSFLKSG